MGSRYYNPEIGRFINADDSDILDGRNNHILENNLFAYCLNNPIIYHDPKGKFAQFTLEGANGVYVATTAAAGGASFWNPAGWVLLGIAVTGTVILTSVAIYNSNKIKHARIAQITSKNMSKTVREILKDKKGSIKNAKPPKGSPGWDSIMDLTLSEIIRRAQQGEPGFNYFKKLLTDSRFNK
jgi:uncharacterized protein RhaS with RHS repeats